MAQSGSRLSYQDCYDLFDKATGSERGTRVKVKTLQESRHLRSRLHYSRALDRKDNKLIYEEGHPLYGRSQYDLLTVKGRTDAAGRHWVYIIKLDQVKYDTEDIGAEDGIDQSNNSDHGKANVEETPPKVEERRRA